MAAQCEDGKWKSNQGLRKGERGRGREREREREFGLGIEGWNQREDRKRGAKPKAKRQGFLNCSVAAFNQEDTH